MTFRQTSREAYFALVTSGGLSHARRLVYDALYRYKAATANELFRTMDRGRREARIVQENIHARLGELRDMGVVRELPARSCRSTGRTAIVWDVTDRVVPLVLATRTTKGERIAALTGLIDEVADYLMANGEGLYAHSIRTRAKAIAG